MPPIDILELAGLHRLTFLPLSDTCSCLNRRLRCAGTPEATALGCSWSGFRNMFLYYGGIQRDEHSDCRFVLRDARNGNGC